MKPNPYLIILGISALTLFIATHPPIESSGKTYPICYVAPRTLPKIDTPDIAETVQRINRKAEILNTKTKLIKKNSEALERGTRQLLQAVRTSKDSIPSEDTTAVEIAVETPPEKPNLWKRTLGRLGGLFSRQ